MADSLKALFESSGYRADVAYGGKEALAKLADEDYQVVITDIRMDDCDGYEVMRFVKENKPKTLVIAITGYASTESAIEAIRQSAFDYIPKPYEFETLRAAVERALRQIETIQMREDLISMVTHDIKVPLGTIIGYAQMALEGEGGGLHPRAREFLELISINSQRILSLVDNFLTSCRVEAGRLEIAELPIDLAETIEELRPFTELEARKRGIGLDIRIEPGDTVVAGDPNLLFRALGNLFQNALKYAGSGGRVEAVLRSVERPENGGSRRWIVFEISNTGEGIDPEEMENIFKRFRRSEACRKPEGMGLGLYVVRCVVDAHHGWIEAQSKPGERTVFRVFLPAALPGETGRGAEHAD